MTSIMAAQTAQEEIKANKFLAASNYLDYERQLSDKPLTPSPKGYEPFYMSHYGRHGSRWLTGKTSYTSVAEPLRKAKQYGKLTDKGEEVLGQLEQFIKGTEKRWGDLTNVGERQHHGIARRMVSNFPEIFKKENVQIDARSTVVIRCILSMTAECEELAAANPTARIHNDVSEAFQYYLNAPRNGLIKKMGRKGREIRNSSKPKDCNRLMAVLFNDVQWANDSIKNDPFIYNLFDVTTNMQSHDTDIDFYSLFNDDEIYEQWRIRNIGWYVDYGPAPITEGMMPFTQRYLLRNIIETTDTITQTQATLRFGHEVCVLPLACLLELDSCGIAVNDLDQLDQYWRNYRIFPMACNIQLVFYRPINGKKGDILVKALLNERECALPVKTKQFPYYRWKDLRQYYLDKLTRFEALEKGKKS
jgi:hypothetical protein